jgi:copper homeostasis protein
MKAVLEVCAFNIQSCLLAQEAGAARVELCDNPIEGGTTPSYGTIKKVRALVQIQLYPIIRPRSMNYWYDDHEFEIMLEDIKVCKNLGCDGISIGVQLQNGAVDGARMRQICDLAYPMGVTSNRVIDAAPDAFVALETLIDAGCERVLTSGQAATAPEGAALLAQLVKQADGRMSIMPGAGVRSSNLAELRKLTGAYEFHSSARKNVENLVEFNNPLISDAGSMVISDLEELKKMVAVLNAE